MSHERLVIAENGTAPGRMLERLLELFPDVCDAANFRAAQDANKTQNHSSPIKVDGDIALLGLLPPPSLSIKELKTCHM